MSDEQITQHTECDESILNDPKYDLPDEALRFLILVVDALYMDITGDEECLYEHTETAKESISGLATVKNLETEKFLLYLRAGEALNKLRTVIKHSSNRKWGDFCRNHFDQSEKTLERWRHVASANIAPEYYHVGYSKLDLIVQGVRKVSKYGQVDTNDILANIDFDVVNKTDCYQTAKNETNKILIRKSQPFLDLHIDEDLADQYIDCERSMSGFKLDKFIEKMSKIPVADRNDAIMKMIATGKQSVESNQSTKEAAPMPSLDQVAADFLSMLKQAHKGDLMPKLAKDIQVELGNYLKISP